MPDPNSTLKDAMSMLDAKLEANVDTLREAIGMMGNSSGDTVPLVLVQSLDRKARIGGYTVSMSRANADHIPHSAKQGTVGAAPGLEALSRIPSQRLYHSSPLSKLTPKPINRCTPLALGLALRSQIKREASIGPRLPSPRSSNGRHD